MLLGIWRLSETCIETVQVRCCYSLHRKDELMGIEAGLDVLAVSNGVK